MRQSKSQRAPPPPRAAAVRPSSSQGSFSPRNAGAWPLPPLRAAQGEGTRSPRRSSPRHSSPRRVIPNKPRSRQSSPVRVPPQRAPPQPPFSLDDEVEVVQSYNSPSSAGIYGTPPKRSPAFDVAPEGGLPTPPGFKGFTLGEWATNNTAQSSPVTPPPAAAGQPFGESRGASMTRIELNAGEQSPGTCARPVLDEEGDPVCCSLLGPVSPFIGGLCLLQTGSSTVLTTGPLVFVRMLQLTTAAACALAGSIIARGTRDASRIIPAALAAGVGLRRLTLVASYRARRSDPKEVHHFSGYRG